MITIYSISCPKNNFVVYVGKTGDFEKRKAHHLYNCQGSIGLYIKGLLKQGLIPTFKVEEEVDDEDAVKSEQKWMDYYSGLNNPLLNIYASSQNPKRRVKQNRKTKYPFSTIGINESFKIEIEDYNSMLTSLRQFNKRHGQDIFVKVEDLDKNKMLVTRVS